MDSTVYPRLNYTKCVDGIAQAVPGSAAHKFQCHNVCPPSPSLYDWDSTSTPRLIKA